MRKILLYILIVIAVIVGICRVNNDNKEIKVRVIASSNSEDDQKLKNNIKDIVLDYLAIVFSDNYDECFSNIKNTYSYLELDLKKVDKNICVDFSKHTLYNKTYNNNAIRNKECYTLYVVIGSGDGDNWWGCVYPKFITNSTSDIKYESLLINVIKKINEEKKYDSNWDGKWK